MVQAMDICTPEEKAVCLRTMINSQALLYKGQIDKILMAASNEILRWLKEEKVKMTEVDNLRIFAAIMRKKNGTEWFQPMDAGNNVNNFK